MRSLLAWRMPSAFARLSQSTPLAWYACLSPSTRQLCAAVLMSVHQSGLKCILSRSVSCRPPAPRDFQARRRHTCAATTVRGCRFPHPFRAPPQLAPTPAPQSCQQTPSSRMAPLAPAIMAGLAVRLCALPDSSAPRSSPAQAQVRFAEANQMQRNSVD